MFLAGGMSCLEGRFAIQIVRCEVSWTGNWVFELERGDLLGDLTGLFGSLMIGAGRVTQFF